MLSALREDAGYPGCATHRPRRRRPDEGESITVGDEAQRAADTAAESGHAVDGTGSPPCADEVTAEVGARRVDGAEKAGTGGVLPIEHDKVRSERHVVHLLHRDTGVRDGLSRAHLIAEPEEYP